MDKEISKETQDKIIELLRKEKANNIDIDFAKSNEEQLERYEFDFDEQINAGGKEELNGFVFDVCPNGCPPMTDKKMCIVLMSEDKSTEKLEEGHRPFGYIEFADKDNFDLAKIGIEILQKAVFLDVELKEELEKKDGK